MELHQVRYFLALVKTMNFTRAAEQCNVSQSSLTKAVQRLERELGGDLVLRERPLTQLADLGKAVLPMLERVVAAAEAIQLQAQDYRRREIAPLKIGLAPSISATIIVQPLSEIARVVPGLQVEMVEASAARLVEMLLEGEVNAALVGDPENLPERIDHWRLFEERYLVVAAPSHPLAVHAAIPIDALADTVWLERVGCDVASRFRRTCFAADVEPKIGHRGRRESHLQHMAAAGLGAMLTPEHAPRLPALSAIPIERDPLRREVRLLVVAGRRYSPALDAFVKIARLRDWRAEFDQARASASERNGEEVHLETASLAERSTGPDEGFPPAAVTA